MPSGQRAFEQRLRFDKSALVAKRQGQIVDCCARTRVIGTECKLIDRKGTSVKWLSIGVAALASIEVRKIGEDNGHRRMVATKRLFANGERTFVKWLRLEIATLLTKQLGQATKRYADIWVITTGGSFNDCQRFPYERLCLMVASLGAIQFRSTIEVLRKGGLIGNSLRFIGHQ